jgi:ParB family transcriptional regulator, chromosome partitioning protein
VVVLKWIPLGSIVGSAFQPRLQEDRELNRLIASIQGSGLVIPIIVLLVAKAQTKAQAKAKASGPTYLMRSGHRRKAALERLAKQGVAALPRGHARIVDGEVQIQALICDNMTDDEAAVAALIDNLEREALTPYEQARALKRLAEKNKIPREELASQTGISPNRVDYMIAALDPHNLTPAMIKSWKQRQLEMGHVRTLFRLREQPKAQKQLYQKILKMNLAVADAEYYCTQLLNPEDLRLDQRELEILKQQLASSKALTELIENKQLRVLPSRTGQKLQIDIQGITELRSAAREILRVTKGFNPDP